MEKEHLIHHNRSPGGSELYTLILLTKTSFSFYCLTEEEQPEFNSGSHIIGNSSQIPSTQLLLLGGCQRQKTQLDIQIPDWVLLRWQLDKPAFDLYVNRANLNWKVIKRKHFTQRPLYSCFSNFPYPNFFFFLKTTLSSVVNCFNANFWSYWSEWPTPTRFDGTRRWHWGKKETNPSFYSSSSTIYAEKWLDGDPSTCCIKTKNF